MSIPLKSISISYRTAPLTIREQVALNEEESKDFALKCKEQFGLNELLIISTCNRTEMYYTSHEDVSNELVNHLLQEKGLSDKREYTDHFHLANETDESLQHLFEVATGLQSKVVGDLQIPNQIKKAYQLATKEPLNFFLLDLKSRDPIDYYRHGFLNFLKQNSDQ
jgi:glutamyl-tRNA reductase